MRRLVLGERPRSQHVFPSVCRGRRTTLTTRQLNSMKTASEPRIRVSQFDTTGSSSTTMLSCRVNVPQPQRPTSRATLRAPYTYRIMDAQYVIETYGSFRPISDQTLSPIRGLDSLDPFAAPSGTSATGDKSTGMRIQVEFYGIARLRAQVAKVDIDLPAAASLSDLFDELARAFPALG